MHVHIPVDALSVMCTFIVSIMVVVLKVRMMNDKDFVEISCYYLTDWNWLWKSETHKLFYTGLFYNGTTGQLTCFNTTEEFIECADPTGCGIGPDSLAWDYQVNLQ